MQAQHGSSVGRRPPVGRHDGRLVAAAAARAQRGVVAHGSASGFRMPLGLTGSDLMGIGPAPRRVRRPVSAAADGATRPRVVDRETTPAQPRPHTVGADPAGGRRLAGLVMQANATKLAGARSAERTVSSRSMPLRQAAWTSQHRREDPADTSSDGKVSRRCVVPRVAVQEQRQRTPIIAPADKSPQNSLPTEDAGKIATRWIQGGTAPGQAAGGVAERTPVPAVAGRKSRQTRGATGPALPAARSASSGETSTARSTLRRAVRKHSNVRLLDQSSNRRIAADARPVSRVGSAGWRGGRCGLDLYGRAAAALIEADVLLVAAGAGMSADSGLAVYKDIASVPAWRKAGLTYSDLCDPCWLDDDPEIFYGFWGSCMNTYMETDPHEGYGIIRRWISEEFSADAQKQDGATSAGARGGSDDDDDDDDSDSEKQEKRTGSGDEDSESEEDDEEDVNERAMVFTSNVDTAFTRAGFAEDGVGVYEIHGDILTWQCSKGHGCSSHTWQIPSTFRFEVSKKTMRARRTRSKTKPKNPAQQQPSPTWTDTEEEDEDEDARQQQQQQEQQQQQQEEEQGPNHPRCMQCSARARPNILMFDDGYWIRNSAQRRGYNRWWKKHRKRMKDSKQLKFVVLEIGAGVRIPTVRENSEKLMKKLPMGQARLIRINPDFELADSSHGAVSTSIIPIKENALSALQKIDCAMQAIKSDWTAAAGGKAAAATGASKLVDSDARNSGGVRLMTPATLGWKRAEATLRKAALAKTREGLMSKTPPFR